ncbi:MAG: PEGA domain-containing protein [Deltaproteobacteria bacterium]|nr:PEGA domain-containing protein [Deltaproteobacteria bacterium]
MVRPRAKWLGVICAVLVCLSLPATGKKEEHNRTQGFVVGMSDDLKHEAGEITHMLRKVMHEVQGIQMLDLAERLQAPPPPKTKEHQKMAQAELKSAKDAMREMEYAKVIQHAMKAQEAFEKMGGYMEPVESYKETILLTAVGHAMQGSMDRAEKYFLDLLILDPHTELPKNTFEDFVLELFRQVKTALPGKPLGSVSVSTTPPGGNLYLNGKLKGVVPDSFDGLVAGRHFIVVKLPGYQNWGKVVTVVAGELVPLDEKLTPGQAGSGFTLIADRAAQAVSDDDLRGEVLRLGQAIGLDWTVLGQLAHDGSNRKLKYFFFEFSRGHVVHEGELEMDASGYGREEEVRRFSREFMRDGMAALKRFRQEGDPLTGHSGTEDWYQDDSKKAKQKRETHAEDESHKTTREAEGGDPLDDVDGTEDW